MNALFQIAIRLNVKRLCRPILVAALLSTVIPTGAAFAAERQALFDWYYSAVFGTGSYRVGDRDVFMASYSWRGVWREAAEDHYAINYAIPVSVGFYDYTSDNLARLETPSDVATLTFLPGFYYVIPLYPDWELKPFVNLGYGKEFAGGEGAWIYSLGVRSLYRFNIRKWRMALGGSLYYAGNRRKGVTDLGFAAADVTWDFNHPVAVMADGETLYLGGYLAAYYFSDLEFIRSDQTRFDLKEQYEVGVTLSAKHELSILGAEVERIGLAYLSGRGFHAWRLVFSFPY